MWSGTGPKFANEMAHPIDERIVGRSRRFWRISSERSGRGRRSWRGCRNGIAFHTALKNERGSHADAPYDNDHPRIDLWLNFGVGLIDQRRHNNLIDGLHVWG